MRTAVLVRIPEELNRDQGTFGKLSTDSGFMCFTGELPWRDNKSDISCIPAGVYQCGLVASNKFGSVYMVTTVPDRTEILIHAGNFCGNKSKGFKSDVEGCILLGRAIGDLGGQRGVKNSKDAVKSFMADRNGEPFTLTIM